VIPSALDGAAVVSPPAMLDARLLLYQTDLHMQAQLQQNQRMLDARQTILSSFLTNPTVASFQQQQQAQLPVSNPIAQGSSEREANMKHSLHQQHLTASHHLDNTASSRSALMEPNVATIAAPSVSQENTPTEEEVSEYLLSVLALSGRAKFTDEQEEAEKANMSDQEKAKVLCDLFGKYCSVHHQDKRAKRDLGTTDIAFLVKQMRMEIEKIPVAEKEALVEAQQKCNRPEEFSDRRLEQFLRCEGMDVKVRCLFRPRASPMFRLIRATWFVHTFVSHSRIILLTTVYVRKQLGARRFSNYWNARRSVFGKEKYLQRMTLSEALRDDIVALETGIFCLLPQKDLSGRQMLYMDPSRHSRDGYTSESLVCASVIWLLCSM
jgi:hypothetical protein